MSEKEEKAKEYADNEEMVGMGFDRKELQWAFEAGWDEALKSQWIKVEERKPKPHEEVLVLFEQDGKIRIETDVYYGDAFYNYYTGGVWYFGGEKIIAWMQIPSFDKILESNKDVLKRLKDK